ncbi:MAG: uracil-DNA glycosylase, partial [Methylophagaceae bacterium]
MALENAPSWQPTLNAEFDLPYMQSLKQFLRTEKNSEKVIYPHSSNWFHALEATPLDEVKVVILGQDPYHQPNQ